MSNAGGDPMGFDVVRSSQSARRTRDRRLRSATRFFRFSPLTLQMQLLPRWVFLSLVGNGVLAIALLAVLGRSQFIPALPPASPVTSPTPAQPLGQTLGQRHQLTYQQWVDQLRQEASVAAVQKPKRLTVLAGDSISLWFPQDLLPAERTWLNQGISGETSAGLLKRLSLFDQTAPETILVMIGINDLIKGVEDKAILDNQTAIVRDLKTHHPKSQIVVQSILPHEGGQAKWEGRDRLAAIAPGRVLQLNQELEAIAQAEGVYYLDLYALFADSQGNIRPELTSDGLHLSPEGYRVWSIALQVYGREVLADDLSATAK